MGGHLTPWTTPARPERDTVSREWWNTTIYENLIYLSSFAGAIGEDCIGRGRAPGEGYDQVCIHDGQLISVENVQLVEIPAAPTTGEYVLKRKGSQFKWVPLSEYQFSLDAMEVLGWQ